MSFRFESRRFFFRLWPLLGLIILLLVFSLFFPRVLTFLARPLAWMGTEIGQFSLFSSSACLTEQAQMSALAVDRALLENLQLENQALRQQLNFFERQAFSQVTANIINRSASPADNIFVIDRGSNDGIRTGAAVVVGDGHLVGRILKTSTQTSTVRSLLSQSSKISASVLNTSRAIGLAEGVGGALLSLHFVPQDQILSVNDLIVTSGLESGIPAGLILGIITNTVSDPAAPFQEATIEPLVDIRLSGVVSVVILPEAL